MLLALAELAEVFLDVDGEARRGAIGSSAANLSTLRRIQFVAQLNFQRFELRQNRTAQALL